MRDDMTVTIPSTESTRQLPSARASSSARRKPQPPAWDPAAFAPDSSTFAPAMALLPPDAREDVACLYRVLRTLDDLVDENDPRALTRVAAVECWASEEEAQAIEVGRPLDTPETRALTALARRHSLSRESLLEFCAGMRHDIARASIETDADFTRYCQQAGGSVGVVLANILGCASPAGEAGMATLGQAMQVTNILRDIDEDLEHGRVYISGAAIERFGFPEPGAREELLRDHIARADALYEEGIQAIPLLGCGRRAMTLATALYREILRQIEREGYGARPGRAVVAPWRRRVLSARCRLA